MRFSVKLFCCWLAAAVGCCGAGGMSEKTVADSESALTQAEEAFEAGNFQQAVDNYTNAIEGGGLRSEMLAEAYIHRAMAHAELGAFDAAQADLEIAEQGAPQMDAVYAARGYVLLKQGDKEQAREQYRLARSINPQIEIPQGL